jgi:uncharacterized protein YutE (UPF0331/DUF86 family)
MDIDIIRVRQDGIARCIRRIQTKAGIPYDLFVEDYDAQDVVVLNLERAVQQAVDVATHVLAETAEPVPETMRDAFDSLRRIGVLTEPTADRMMKAVGFRNTAVHAYQRIDWQIVHSIVTDRLGDFSDFIREVDAYLARNEAGGQHGDLSE